MDNNSYSFIPQGVCCKKINYTLSEDGTIGSVEFIGGCHGNLQGIAALVEGAKASEVISRLKGIDCRGRGTSCPDQFAIALQKEL